MKPGTTASAAKPAATTSAAGAAAMAPGTAPSGSSTSKSKSSEHAEVKWSDIARWLDHDPRSRPAGPLPAKCDPFQTIQVEPVARVKREAPKAIVREATPQSLGMVLSGTILSDARSVARISGRTYEKGSPVAVMAKDGKPVTFVLTEVDSKRVILQRAGEKYELSLPGPKRSGLIEISGSTH